MSRGDKIRVLIVDDVAETRENIRKLLQFENDIDVIGAARTGREAVQLCTELRPDVVIMDINMPDMDGITATETIRRAIPYIQVVILSVQGDSSYMRRAMLAGARDFLTKPPAVDELNSAIRRAGRMAQDERAKGTPTMHGTSGGLPNMGASPGSLGKVLLVYSPKGGTGCTTLAINLAVTLHNDETPVVLVDGDLQFGDIPVFLNIQGKTGLGDLITRVDELDNELVESVLISHSTSGLKVLSAPSRLEQSENIDSDRFSKILEFLRHYYSYVVVDTSSTLADHVIAGMDTSDLIILITTQDIPALKNARLFLDLAVALGIQNRRILFVMNRFDKRIGITPEKIGESFKHEVSAVIPLDERVVVPSINRGMPFMLGDRTRAISRSFLTLAESVRQRSTELSDVNAAEKEPVVVRR